MKWEYIHFYNDIDKYDWTIKFKELCVYKLRVRIGNRDLFNTDKGIKKMFSYGNKYFQISIKNYAIAFTWR
jgi:hypothetical protein